MPGVTHPVSWTARTGGGTTVKVYHFSLISRCAQVCVERRLLQPAGRDELPDDQPGLQSGGGATAENSPQHPQQGRQVGECLPDL